MTHRKVKKEVIYVLYTLTAVLFVAVIALTEVKLNKKPEKNDFVNKTIFEKNIPVVAQKEIIIRPYTDNSITIATNYYSLKDEEEMQKKSLIFYENTYLPSTGIDYKGEYDFDVVSILDGIVITVKEDQILGKIVEVKHNNNIISTYQSLSEVVVHEGDEVKQGTLLGKSGTSNIEKNLGSHLHFELTVDSHTVDPEEYYDKELGEL